jgi:hypothetical protein
MRKLAVEAADNGLLAPELASGIAKDGRPLKDSFGRVANTDL